jgi:tetratricopeptide (TPR) repeat protein
VKAANTAPARAILQQQVDKAFYPLANDPRIRTLEARLKKDGADNAARLELGAIYESYRLYPQALEQYTGAFDHAPSEPAILGIVRSEHGLKRAWRAIPILEEFVRVTPSAATWNALGLLYGASGDLPAGERALREAVAAGPSSDLYLNNLGYNLLAQNKTADAETEFRRALELNPKSATVHNNLGTLLARKGEIEAALQEFQSAADAATAHNNLAVVLMEMGRYELSREHLVKSLAIRRDFAPAFSNFKLVQERLRQRAETQRSGSTPGSGLRVASAAEGGNKPIEEQR